ncbi:MAG: ankyrin repeat domain-containing protein [Opitutaceae bacterium]
MLGIVEEAGAAKRPPALRYFTDPADLELVEAAARGDLKGIDAAIKAGADVNAEGTDGFVPLAYALLSMNKKGFSALLDRGADPNVKVAKLPGLSTSLVGMAAQGEDSFWLKELIAHDAKLDFATSFGGLPPIAIAITLNRIDNMRLMIEEGVDLDFERMPLGDTPLLNAAMNGKWEAVYILLEAGADWQRKVSSGLGMVDLLEIYTNNPGKDRSGTFWMWRTKVAQWLKDHGADVPDEILNAK